MNINDAQIVLSLAVQSVFVLAISYFSILLFVNYSAWSRRKAVEAAKVTQAIDKAAEQLQLEPISFEPHNQIPMPPEEFKNGEKEHLKKKKVTGKKVGAVKSDNNLSLNGHKVQIYQLRGQSVVMVDDLPFSIPQTAKTYQLRGKPAITLLIAQEIANQFTAVKEVKKAA
jgi:hypothetical protein